MADWLLNNALGVLSWASVARRAGGLAVTGVPFGGFGYYR
jgi:hypothetical protein